jgi:uncharacterized protein (TIGR00369 family)
VTTSVEHATATDATATDRTEGVRSRTITWTDPARVRFRQRGLDGFARLRAMQRGEASPPPAAALLGLSFDELEPGRTVFSVVADELHENPMGTMHGGIISTLVDTAMGCAVSSTLPSDAGFTTLELSTNFVRAITQSTGRVHAEGRVVHGGGRVITTEARVYDDAGTLYAHAKSTCLIQRSAR